MSALAAVGSAAIAARRHDRDDIETCIEDAIRYMESEKFITSMATMNIMVRSGGEGLYHVYVHVGDIPVYDAVA